MQSRVLVVLDSTGEALIVGGIMQPRVLGVPDPTGKASIVGAIVQPRVLGVPDPTGKFFPMLPFPCFACMFTLIDFVIGVLSFISSFMNSALLGRHHKVQICRSYAC